MSDDIVNVEIDGEPVEARKGEMIIQVTDRVGAYVPRFCYHEKLSIAANCRMCLVEVEKAPKPLPACATPVGEGMKISTRSKYAQGAQKATMEFLLINHPLDCPICDQGGECELQDLAMGFGRGVSRFTERKRVVKDKDIGPLVSTDMTRCIHCTRCVRFGEEIAGIPELGTIGRGENMKISTYIEKAIDHELSGNIIDLCPVGALNSKPYRYSARAWEMMQRPAISPHDCVGSNLSAHVLRGTVKRVVPRENEDINETWISDRDRFSYEGIYSDDRLLTPRIHREDKWLPTDWAEALEVVVERLQAADPSRIGLLAGPSTTVEEGYLLSRLADHLGTANIDHRLRQQDFSDQDNDPLAPVLGCSIADLESSDSVLVIGSNLRHEAPIIAHRVRKAATRGAAVSFVNPTGFDYRFDVSTYVVDEGLQETLAGIAVAACDSLPSSISALCDGVDASKEAKRIAQQLKKGKATRVLLGGIAMRHPAYAGLRALAAAIAQATGASLGYVTDGANSAGLHLAGVLPHRQMGGEARADAGSDAQTLPVTDLDVLLVFGAESGLDMADIDASGIGCVIGVLPYRARTMESVADLLLPMGTFAETSGTYVNCEGRWQSFGGISNPVGEARPGWKLLRVLGNRLGIDDFDYESSDEVLAAFREALGDVELSTEYSGSDPVATTDVNGDHVIDVPLYGSDPVVRRARALQLTPEAGRNNSRGEAA